MQNPDLRRSMGEAGRRRAREVYDWPVVFAQYQALWADLNARRAKAVGDPELRRWLEAAPTAAAARLDPFDAFRHYPTRTLGPQSRLCLAPGATRADLKAALDHTLFGSLSLERSSVEALYAVLETGDLPLAEASTRINLGLPPTVRTAGLLLKMGLVALAGCNAAWFHGRGGLARRDALARAQTLLSLGIWLAVIIFGRWIAYS